MSKAQTTAKGDMQLPLVVQIGFSGSRELFSLAASTGGRNQEQLELEAELASQFEEILRDEIQFNFENKSNLFFCGISQAAIGSDIVFSNACKKLRWTQRIFLPQHRDAYLNAEGTYGPDFTDSQRADTEQVLSSSHIIQERVVSHSVNRQERFEETNLEIIHASDVLVAIVNEDNIGRKGGTDQFIKSAQQRSRPLLKITVKANPDSGVQLSHEWIGPPINIPQLPASIAKEKTKIDRSAIWPSRSSAEADIPSSNEYTKYLKNLSSEKSKWKQNLFKWYASIIIGSHIAATLMATIALKLGNVEFHKLLIWLLNCEIAFLVVGFGVHQWLHKTHAVEHWALYRLIAEVARSRGGVGTLHVYLSHFFTLPFHKSLNPLLRTINVLHLFSTRKTSENWQTHRKRYIEERLGPFSNDIRLQIPYYDHSSKQAKRKHKRCLSVFKFASLIAIIATAIKLLVALHWIPLDENVVKTVKTITGSIAIMLPIIAVAVLSLAAAFDFVATEHTSKELHEFLVLQVELLEQSSSSVEYSRLVLQTEERLLGETVNWYSRRTFVSVA